MKHVKLYEDFLNEASAAGRAWSGKLANLDNLFSWMYSKGILSKGEKAEKDKIFNQYYRWYNDGDFPPSLRAKGFSKWMGDDKIEQALESLIEEFMKKILNKYTGKYDRREFHIDTLLGDLNTLENIVAGYENRDGSAGRGEPDPYGLLNYWGKKINTGDSEFEKLLGELGPLYKDVDESTNKAFAAAGEYNSGNTTIAWRRQHAKDKGFWTGDLEKKYQKMKDHMLRMHEILKNVVEATQRAKAALNK
jgi:hypothetical protein